MSMWKRVRMTLLHNESNRNLMFPDQVRELLPTCSRQDQVLLEDLIDMPCVEQHKIIESQNPYLNDEEADMLLKACCPMMKEIYDFSFPSDMLLWYKELTQERDTKELFFSNKPSSEYIFSKEDIDKIINKCKDVIMSSSITTNKKYYDMVVAVQILTGRRSTEVVNSATFLPSSHIYQAQVTGLLKDSRRIDDVISIPLLAPFKDISRAFRMLREFKNYSDKTNVEISSATKSGIGGATKRLFGRRLTHTQKRNIYCETCYDRRYQENEFLLDTCTKQAWIATVLGHKLTSNMLTPTSRYQIMQIV